MYAHVMRGSRVVATWRVSVFEFDCMCIEWCEEDSIIFMKVCQEDERSRLKRNENVGACEAYVEVCGRLQVESEDQD